MASHPPVHILKWLDHRSRSACVNCSSAGSVFLPNHTAGTIAEFDGTKAFVGRFTADGAVFVSACQDRMLRLYTTEAIVSTLAAKDRLRLRHVRGRHRSATPFKVISAKDVGWSIVDVDFSPDQNFLIYSSWSNYIHLCNVTSSSQVHEALDLEPTLRRHFCAFSIRISPDSHEILAGTSEYALYMYDIEKGCRTVRLQAHEDDINTVAFAEDNSSQVFVSGSDDALCKVWDKRCLRGSGRQQPARPVGTLVGHTDGLVFVASKGDGRYLLTNAKDQTAKLFDLRRLQGHPSTESLGAEQQPFPLMPWDYRYSELPQRLRHPEHPNDQAVMTFRGHRVLQTLIRAGFSPASTTGQRFAYTGSHDGHVYIYDLHSGHLVTRLAHHRSVVRDVSWHPDLPLLLTTSWDGTHAAFDYQSPPEGLELHPEAQPVSPRTRRPLPGDDTLDRYREFHPRVSAPPLPASPPVARGTSGQHLGNGQGASRFAALLSALAGNLEHVLPSHHDRRSQQPQQQSVEQRTAAGLDSEANDDDNGDDEDAWGESVDWGVEEVEDEGNENEGQPEQNTSDYEEEMGATQDNGQE